MIHPSAEGNCTVRVGHGLDQEESDEGRFIVLKPRDGSANDAGQFPCGREVGYEGKEFKLPKNFTCDSCTLQLEWALPNGDQIHQCADFLMAANESKFLFRIDPYIVVEECSGKCQNGGVCVNGECMCRTNYSGSYCQYRDQVTSRMIWYFLAFTLIAAIIVGIFIYVLRLRKQMERMPPAQVDDNPDSIIGSNPEPSALGRFGL